MWVWLITSFKMEDEDQLDGQALVSKERMISASPVMWPDQNCCKPLCGPFRFLLLAVFFIFHVHVFSWGPLEHALHTSVASRSGKRRQKDANRYTTTNIIPSKYILYKLQTPTQYKNLRHRSAALSRQPLFSASASCDTSDDILEWNLSLHNLRPFFL